MKNNIIDPTFLELSARLGQNPQLVQGAGGNTSIKAGPIMWVKASGTWLLEAINTPIFIAINLHRAQSLIADGKFEFDQSVLAEESELRPSIETVLHAIMPHKVVLHVHSVNAMAWAACAEPSAQLKQLLSEFNWLWVPYKRPGAPLAKSINSILKPETSLLILQNHGLVLGAESVYAAEKLLQMVENKLNLELPTVQSTAAQSLKADTACEECLDPTINALALDIQSFRLAQAGYLFPDEVVFLYGKLHFIEDSNSQSSLPDLLETSSERIVIWQKRGVAFSKQLKASSLQALLCLAQVVIRLKDMPNLRYLNSAEIEELLDWDAEKYRIAAQAG